VPETMQMVEGDMILQVRQCFQNLAAIAQAAGGSLNDCVKVHVFLTDLANFPIVNQVMSEFFTEPYPARAAVGVAALPRAAQVEVDAIMVIND
jgi:reactive intermediate/imine deaminase